jgi:hypothetical protein
MEELDKFVVVSSTTFLSIQEVPKNMSNIWE